MTAFPVDYDVDLDAMERMIKELRAARINLMAYEAFAASVRNTLDCGRDVSLSDMAIEVDRRLSETPAAAIRGKL